MTHTSQHVSEPISQPISRLPLWQTAPATRPTLAENLNVDVAIVGGGFTGLWTAYYLLTTDPTLRVAIIEREHIGFGASGRNGGWASSIFPVSLARVAKLYSRQDAINLQAAMNDTVTEIGRIITAELFDADFTQSGYLALARNQAQLANAKATIEGSAAFGFTDRWQLLSPDEATNIINASDTLGGIFTEHCALLNPGKLVQALGAKVEALGGTIYEHTEASTISQGTVTTRSGTITADVVVRATEAFTPQFPEYRRDVVPLYSLVIATEPIEDSLWKELGFHSRTAFNDLRHLRIYAHPTADRRLLFGGRGAPYKFGSKVDPSLDHNPAIHRKIEHTMREFFHELRDTRVTHQWGGPLGVPRDWFPSVGYNRSQKLAWAGPYVGDGVATSNLAGRILTEKILNQTTELQHLPISRHHIKKWEPEPLRWLGVTAGLTSTSVADAEERLTGKPSMISRVLEKLTGAH